MESIIQFLPIILAFGVAYFFFVLPQQRRTREHESLMKSLEEGDEVQLASGIFGFISSLNDSIVWLEVAPGVELKVARSSVASRVVDISDTDEDEE